MARDDGVKVGAGGKVMVQEIVEVTAAPTPLAEKQNKVEVLKEVIQDTLPSDVEAEIDGDDDEDVQTKT